MKATWSMSFSFEPLSLEASEDEIFSFHNVDECVH
jgi:hypothetical protein